MYQFYISSDQECVRAMPCNCNIYLFLFVNSRVELDPAAAGEQSQFFQFDSEYRQRFQSQFTGGGGDAQRSPGYLQQVSPISPAPGAPHPSSPTVAGGRGVWTAGYNPLEYVQPRILLPLYCFPLYYLRYTTTVIILRYIPVSM